MTLVLIVTIIIAICMSSVLCGFKIEDGTGTGYQAGVNNENRLTTHAVTVAKHHHLNKELGFVWSISFENIDPSGADDYFFYFKNTSSDADYVIPKIRLATTVAGQVELHSVSGTASGGSDNTPVNRNLGAANTITGTIQTGSDITGLTNDGILAFMQLDTVNRQYELDIESHIVVAPSKAVALLWEAATGALTGTITVYKELL